MSQHKYALGVVGTGHIATVIIQRLLESGYLTGDRIIVSDSRTLQRRLAAETVPHGHDKLREVAVTTDNAEVVRGSRIVMISVTPQKFAEAAASFGHAAGGDRIFLSLMAGMPTARVAAALGQDPCGTAAPPSGTAAPGRVRGPIRVVRAMPNLPFGLGCGVTGLFRGEHATQDDMEEVKHLFSAGGVSVVVEDEALMDAVTAVAGSGPAYFYYFVEMLMEAGVAAGLLREDAQVLAAHACVGAGAMLLEEGSSPRELRDAVTSPGGTTEAAMKTLTECKVAEHVTSAVLAAFRRGQELGKLHAGK